MRLLKRSPSGGFDLVSFDDDRPPLYVILSHPWIDGQEVTYGELASSGVRDKNKTSYAKIRFCVDSAVHDGIDYGWIDTCCTI
jgi:hypothetical protein